MVAKGVWELGEERWRRRRGLENEASMFVGRSGEACRLEWKMGIMVNLVAEGGVEAIDG